MCGKRPLHPVVVLFLMLIIVLNSACLTAGIEPDEAVVPDAAEITEVQEVQEVPLRLIAFGNELKLPEVPFLASEPVLDRKSSLPLPPRRKTGVQSPEAEPEVVLKQYSGKSPALEPEAVSAPGDEVDTLQSSDFSDMEAEFEQQPAALPEKEDDSFLSVLFDPNKLSGPVAPEAEPEPVAAVEPEPKPADAVSEAVLQPADAGPDEIIKSPAGEVVTIVLEGEGWILERMISLDGSETGDIRFNGREYRSGQTVFSFYPFHENIFIIQFRLIDFSSGLTEEKTVRVEAVSSDTAPEPDDELEVSEPADDIDPQMSAAAAAETPYEDDSSIETTVQPVEIEIPDDVPALVEYAEALSAAGRCAEAASVLEEKIGIVSWTEADRLYFSLAEFYQNCSGIRDERKAAHYYRHIIDYYPVSNYWRLSKERLNYLERNFIHIR